MWGLCGQRFKSALLVQLRGATRNLNKVLKNIASKNENPDGGKEFIFKSDFGILMKIKLLAPCPPSGSLGADAAGANIRWQESSKFRDYSVDTTDPLKERVRQTYRQMHLNQTVDFVKGKWIYQK